MPLVRPALVGNIVAHQGGWDEALLIAGPIVAIVGLLLLAKRRVDRLGSDATGGDGDDQPGERSIDAPT
jgi:hypothetical protein